MWDYKENCCCFCRGKCVAEGSAGAFHWNVSIFPPFWKVQEFTFPISTTKNISKKKAGLQ